MSLAVLVLMPVGLTLVYYFALGNLYQDPLHPEMSHFDYLVPGAMGYAVIYMGMMIALALCDYRQAGLLRRLQSTPASPYEYLGSLLVANMIIAVVQGLLVLLVAWLLGFEAGIGILGLLMVILFLAVLAMTAVGLGLLTASIGKSTGAASGLSMIFIMPMMVFGTFLAVFDESTYRIAHFTPNFYTTDALTLIFRGEPLSTPQIWNDFLILAVISVVLTVAGIELFRRSEFR
jgi:ABC-2 type transport system permease protein